MHEIKHLRVRHLQIVEFMLANPAATYEEISKIFSVSVPWISVLYRSQMFQTKLRDRMKEHEALTDLTVVDQVQSVAQLGLERLANFISHSGDPDFVLDATDKLLRRAGYGTAAGNVTVNNTVQNNTKVVVGVDQATLAECRALLNGEVPALPAPQPVLLENQSDASVHEAADALPARAVAAG